MKEQNSVHLAGWILEHEEETELIKGMPGYVLSTTLRSDRWFYGGHHRVCFLNWIGLQARTYLDIFAEHNGAADITDVESLSGEELSQHFLKVVISGWLCDDRTIVTEVVYLNVTETMRCEAKRQLAQMKKQIDNYAWPESSQIVSRLIAG